LPRLRSNFPDQGLLGAVSELRTGSLFGYTRFVFPFVKLPLLRDCASTDGAALREAPLPLGTVRFVSRAMFRREVHEVIMRPCPIGSVLTEWSIAVSRAPKIGHRSVRWDVATKMGRAGLLKLSQYLLLGADVHIASTTE
jgi:hypothetical protein